MCVFVFVCVCVYFNLIDSVIVFDGVDFVFFCAFVFVFYSLFVCVRVLACALAMRQNAARHAGAMHVLVELMKSTSSQTEMLEIAAAAIRNLCGNSVENAEVFVA